MTRRVAVVAVTLAVTIACGPKLPPAAPGAPHFPDFVPPAAPAATADSQRDAWALLQAGDISGAERQLSVLLKRSPGDASVRAMLGYAALAHRDADRAISRFNEALRLAPSSASALVGRGLALAGEGRAPEALASFEAAHAADASLDLAARIEALRFRAVEETVAKARGETAAGRLDAARAAYQSALAVSPESALLLRELAGVERQAGDRAAARQHLERAIQIDSGDRVARLQLADLLEEQGDLAGAIASLESAQTLDRSPEVESRLTTLRERGDLARLPNEFRAIADAPAVTRAQVAALLGVHLPGLLRAAPRRPSALVTDIARSWAARWITEVLEAGILEPFPNHTFQPEAEVRRSDFAAMISRVLALASTLDPPRAHNWQHDEVAFKDVPRGHPAFDAASRAVGTRVLSVTADGEFQPTRAVTGAEAVEAVTRLQRLIGPRGGARRQ